MRNVDLTEKLGLGEKPTITIRDTVLTVNDEATNVLRVMKMVQDGVDPQTIFDAAELLFDKASRKALKELGLSFGDMSEVVSTAVDLAVGVDESPKAGTPGTA